MNETLVFTIGAIDDEGIEEGSNSKSTWMAFGTSLQTLVCKQFAREAQAGRVNENLDCNMAALHQVSSKPDRRCYAVTELSNDLVS